MRKEERDSVPDSWRYWVTVTPSIRINEPLLEEAHERYVATVDEPYKSDELRKLLPEKVAWDATGAAVRDTEQFVHVDHDTAKDASPLTFSIETTASVAWPREAVRLTATTVLPTYKAWPTHGAALPENASEAMLELLT